MKDKLKWVVDKAFCGGSNQWIRIQGQGAKFDNGNKASKSGKLFSKKDVHSMIDYIVDNAIFCAGNKAFQQIIGIPMGTDPAPFMANIYLFYYEFKYMERLQSEDYATARRLYSHTRRFIDDLATLNNKGHLGSNWTDIYPPELILNKENETETKASFLDLDISVQHNVYCTQIYDKRDAFKFDIVNFPDISGNIPEDPAYGVCIGQLLRIARNTSNLANFITRARLLISKLLNKNYNQSRLVKAAKKCLTGHHDIFTKYDVDDANLMIQIFNL